DDFVTRLPPPVPIPRFAGLTFPPSLPEFITYEHAGTLVFIDGDGAVDPTAAPTALTDVFAGLVNWSDVFQTVLRDLLQLPHLLGGDPPTQILDVPVPAGPVRDHAPIYYARFLREAGRTATPTTPA